jgi:hypothetical protein
VRVFDEPNIGDGWKCPLCGTADKKPVILAGIQGTEDGNNMQAEQIHLDCIELQIIELPGGEKALAQFYYA